MLFIRKALLPLFFAVVFGFASIAPVQAVNDIVISIDTIVRSQEGVVTVLVTVPVDAGLVGATCAATADGANQTSVHPNNDLLIDTGGTQAILDDVEQTPGKITPASNDVVLGTTITISLIMGRHRVFSGGFVISFDCVPVNPTTTTTSTTVPPTTTTTSTTSTTVPPTTTTTSTTSTTVPPTTTTTSTTSTTVPPTTTTSTTSTTLPTTTTSTTSTTQPDGTTTTTTTGAPDTTTTTSTTSPTGVLPNPPITQPPTTASTTSTTTTPTAVSSGGSTTTTQPPETLPLTGLASDMLFPLGLALLGLGLTVEALVGRREA